MSEIALSLDPSTWNVIKFIILSITIIPLLEFLYDHLVSSAATYNALQGKRVPLSDSRLGVFALHSTYWGPRRNVLFSLFLGLIVLGAQLCLEFSFSSIPITEGVDTQVWLPPNHEHHYVRGEGNSNYKISKDPSRFPELASMFCIEENLRMNRASNGHVNAPDSYIPGYEYRTNATFTIRQPYLEYKDNVTVKCSEQKNAAFAEFVSPRIVVAPNDSGVEGFYALQQATGFRQVQAALREEAFKHIAIIEVVDNLLPVFVTKSHSCIASRVSLQYCVVVIEDKIIIAFTETEGSQSGKLRNVLMVAQGAALSKLKERGRQIRLLASIISDNVAFPWSSQRDLPISAHLARKQNIESVAKMMLIVANEEGVGGLKVQHGVRRMKGLEELQKVTINLDFAVPCCAVLLGIMVVILLIDMVLRLAMAWTLRRKFKYTIMGAVKVCTWLCIQTSPQWFRKRVAADLRQWHGFDDLQHSDLQFRLIQDEGYERFTMIPKRELL